MHTPLWHTPFSDHAFIDDAFTILFSHAVLSPFMHSCITASFGVGTRPLLYHSFIHPSFTHPSFAIGGLAFADTAWTYLLGIFIRKTGTT